MRILNVATALQKASGVTTFVENVVAELRALGHEAYSCDIQEPSGGHPEWHILGDALAAIEGGK